MKSGDPDTKRRTYMYFEQMQFLIPQTQDRGICSNSSPMTGSKGEEDTDERREDEKVQVVAHPKLLQVKSNSAKLIPRGR